jgi:hypothetical protein
MSRFRVRERTAPSLWQLSLPIAVSVMFIGLSTSPGNIAQSAPRGTITPSPSPAITGIGLLNPPGPLIVPGTYVTFSCPYSWLNVSSGASVHCSNTTTPAMDECDSSNCTFTISAKAFPGHVFYGWSSSGEDHVWCSTCYTTSLSVFTPNSGDKYSASLTSCTTTSCYTGSCSEVTTVVTHGVQTVSGYKVAWVNWTGSIGSTTVSFKWGTTSSYSPGLQIPEPTGNANEGSFELNNVGAGTTYYYEIALANGCGDLGPWTQDKFTTSGATSGEYSGWVYQGLSQPNANLVFQEGSSQSGAWVNFTAFCWTNATYAQGMDSWQKVTFNLDTGGYLVTNRVGYYSATFEMGTNYTGEDRYNTVVYYDAESGACETSEDYQGTIHNAYFDQTNFTMTVTATSGVWVQTRSVTSTPNATTGYQPFVLTQDTVSYAPVTLALVHSVDAQCESSWTTGSSQTVIQYLGGTGNSYEWDNVSQIGPQWPGWGNDSGIELGYQTTGIMNEATLQPVNAWGVAYKGAASVPYTTTDWLSDTSFNGGNPSSPYLFFEVPSSYHETNPFPYTWTQTSTYSSTSGTDVSIDLSVDVEVNTPGVSFGVSSGVSFQLTDTTTSKYTTQATMGCEFYDPSSTQTAVFYYTFGGGTTAFQPIVHVWLAGYCAVGKPTC